MANDGPEFKNTFQRGEESRRAARAASDTQNSREEAREKQREAWRQHKVPRTPGGIAAGTAVVQAKTAFDADRKKSESTTLTPVISPSALRAVVESWCRNTTEGQTFHIGDVEIDNFNGVSLNRAIQHFLKAGSLVSVELVAAAYAWALGQNYFDTRRRDAAGNIVSIRGGKHLSPPTVCPPCIWPDEEQQLAQEETEKVITARLAEDTANKKKSFDQLQREARSSFKAPRPGGPNLERSY